MKKTFITTAIPYVNAKPHLGHALLFLYGDVLSRFYNLLGHEVRFSVGTDEHGSKILEKAKSLDLEPQVFVDQTSQVFKNALEVLQISYTDFIRTTDVNHVKQAGLIWNKLEQAGLIYKGKYQGWYCVGCEAYKTQTQYQEDGGICVDHNRKYTSLKEDNYFFKLSYFQDVLKQKIESDQLKIIPRGRKNEILAVLETGLEDVSVSRPRSNLNWGIAVPNNPDQVMYVWFEALMNYVTVLGYFNDDLKSEFWPARFQVIGKDIIRFHALIWPAMLLGLELPLYKNLYVHGLVQSQGMKMSKSLGNVIDPLELVEQYGLEAVRYYFLRQISAYEGGNFDLERFKQLYNSELVDKLGNLIYRVQALLLKYDCRLPVIPDLKIETQYQNYMEQCHFNKALDWIFSKITELNALLEAKQPWSKTISESDRQQILQLVVIELVQIGRYLSPFLLKSSNLIEQMFTKGQLEILLEPPFLKLE